MRKSFRNPIGVILQTLEKRLMNQLFEKPHSAASSSTLMSSAKERDMRCKAGAKSSSAICSGSDSGSLFRKSENQSADSAASRASIIFRRNPAYSPRKTPPAGSFSFISMPFSRVKVSASK